MKSSFKGVLISRPERGGGLLLETQKKTYRVNLIRTSLEKVANLIGKDIVAKGNIKNDGETIVISKLSALIAPLDDLYYEKIEEDEFYEGELSKILERSGHIEIDDTELAS